MLRDSSRLDVIDPIVASRLFFGPKLSLGRGLDPRHDNYLTMFVEKGNYWWRSSHTSHNRYSPQHLRFHGSVTLTNRRTLHGYMRGIKNLAISWQHVLSSASFAAHASIFGQTFSKYLFGTCRYHSWYLSLFLSPYEHYSFYSSGWWGMNFGFYQIYSMNNWASVNHSFLFIPLNQLRMDSSCTESVSSWHSSRSVTGQSLSHRSLMDSWKGREILSKTYTLGHCYRICHKRIRRVLTNQRCQL